MANKYLFYCKFINLSYILQEISGRQVDQDKLMNSFFFHIVYLFKLRCLLNLDYMEKYLIV